MGYCGAVPSEDSSGKRIRRGSITKTGNAHLRRIVVEAAWSYRRPPGIWYGLRRRQESVSEEVKEIAWKAQHRLHKRYMKLAAAGKDQRKIITAVGRELLGFIWAIGTRAETTVKPASCSLTKATQRQKQKLSKEGKNKNVRLDEHCHPISSTEPAAAGASTKENPRLAYATGSAGLAITVRGSSRRIMIMRFRPANIRLINRRSNLPRLLLALSSENGKNNDNNKNNPTDPQQLTGSLHIRPNRSSSGKESSAAVQFATWRFALTR